MSTNQLTAVDQAMAFCDASVPQPLIDAWSYTTTFAQANARTVNDDPSTQAYFDAMTGELAKLAWNITEASKVAYSNTANQITPAAIVSSILNPYLAPDQQAALGGLLNAFQQPPTSEINNFLTFWWNKGSTQGGKSNMAFGPLTVVNNASDITMTYYSFNFSADSWRALFVARDSADLDVTAYRLRMNLNMALYNQISGDLIQKVGAKAANHIATAELDL
ncbi:MAG TPA: hypothetical protein VK358_16895 [Longimicrobium sp.]|nr:hypothetical protein [Longimicrobium sp.]